MSLVPFLLPQLRLEQSNISGLLDQSHLGALLKNLADVERLLRDVDLLSGLARLLPKGACAGHQPPTIANTTSWSSNTTTWGPNTTDSPVEEGEGTAGNEAEAENPRSQFSAFVQLWAGLQPILCGNNRCVYECHMCYLSEWEITFFNNLCFIRIIEPEALKQGNMSSLGFTSKEQRNLGLLVHLMTTNPKILYSPIGSEVDKVIQKASPDSNVFQGWKSLTVSKIANYLLLNPNDFFKTSCWSFFHLISVVPN